MEKVETYNIFDKSLWPNGSWKNEPDQVDWVDSKTGYACSIMRNKFGVLCGYVSVGKNHPLYKKDYKDDVGLSVHGGITYTNLDEDEWWIGFDCGHYLDFMPGFYIQLDVNDCVYKDITFVTQEVESLCEQLKKLDVK